MMKPLIGTDLKRFLRDYRRDHRPNRTLAAILQSVEYPINVGSIFRIADGADFADLYLTGITPTPPHPAIEKAGRGKDSRTPWHYHKEPLEAIQIARAQGYRIVAVELADGAVPYHRYEYPEKTCLVVGHEDHGVTKAVLAACDDAVFIPMYGQGLSLNVHVALAVVAFHALTA